MVFFVSCFCPFGSLDIRFVCCLKTWSKKGDTFCFDAPSSGFSVVVVFEIGGIGVRKFLWLIVLAIIGACMGFAVQNLRHAKNIKDRVQRKTLKKAS